MHEFHEIKNKVETHEKEINCLKDDLEEHQEKHNKLYIETKINTKKLEYIERALISILGIVIFYVLGELLKKI